MESFLLAFIPLFVAIDPIASVPLFLSLTSGFTKQEKRVLALQATGTALIIGMTFGIAGSYIFRVLGITSADFRVAGGILLLIFSINEISGSTPKQIDAQVSDKLIGVVPLGIPLIAGPAMMTTLLILQESHSYWMIFTALFFNMVIMMGMFMYAEKVEKVVGVAVSRVIAKVIAIFLAAIGIMMVRKGLEDFLLNRTF